jgi:hypothetical protein
MAMTARHSLALCGIAGIIGWRAEIEMLRVHAVRCVATMQKIAVGWKGAAMQLPRETVRVNLRAAMALLDRESPVAVRIAPTEEQPARLSLDDLRPQPIGQWDHGGLVEAVRGAILSNPSAFLFEVDPARCTSIPWHGYILPLTVKRCAYCY